MKEKNIGLINIILLRKDTIRVEYLLKEKMKIKRLFQKDMDDSLKEGLSVKVSTPVFKTGVTVSKAVGTGSSPVAPAS